jgi:predicted RNase H-like nuclease (RuvC/YqgF family)
MTNPAEAEFYKYTDQNGNIRFTDDITIVPREQRQQLKVYEESKPAGQITAPAVSKEASPEAVPETEAPLVGDVDEDQLRAMHEALERKKSALADQYQALTEARRALESRRDEIRTKEAAEQYQENVRRFNERNDAFEQKRKAFDEEVKSYGRLNARFAETQQPEKALPQQTTP